MIAPRLLRPRPRGDKVMALLLLLLCHVLGCCCNSPVSGESFLTSLWLLASCRICTANRAGEMSRLEVKSETKEGDSKTALLRWRFSIGFTSRMEVQKVYVCYTRGLTVYIAIPQSYLSGHVINSDVVQKINCTVNVDQHKRPLSRGGHK